jgi:hypothetical protein
MSFGLEFKNDSDVVVLDSVYTRLVVLAKGQYVANQDSGLGSMTSFPAVVTSQEPPLVFVRPSGTSGVAGLCLMKVMGSPGSWTGFYVRAYDVKTRPPNGSYFVCGFAATATANYGLRMWDETTKLVFDSDTPYARFTRSFQNWTYVRTEYSEQRVPRNYYKVDFNFPDGEHMLINNFGMNMINDGVQSRELYCLWDFNGATLYAMVSGLGNPFAFFLPAVFAKL